jgi:WD40 repeat protein/serine/threonine protein kinase/Flp pilus assembly protein TadD
VLLTRLADEFAARFRAGECPSLQEYIDRYPELADEMREFLPAMVKIEQVKEGSQEAAEHGATRTAPVLQQLGDFRILREVGKGGMGIVYEAEQLSLGRHVALKLLPRNVLLDTRAKRRFEREAKSAARLHHTNIVPVFGVGEQDGMPYYVMQFIQGLGLDVVLEELKKLQAGGARADSRLGGEPLASGNAGRASDGPGEAGGPKTRTDGAMSAVNVARSLLTGAFHSQVDRDLATAPLTVQDTGGATAPGTAEPASRQDPGPAVPHPRAASDSFTPSSSSSVVLPGQGRDGSTTRNSKRTYWQGVATIGVQVAQALEYAHKQGIQHRDIKPSNLLLDAQGTVWVADFGLAKADDQQNLTHTGDILGTLRYMPPEAFEGRTDARSDVYSLGLTLYEMLAFRAAFDEKERNRLIKQVTESEPERLGKLNRHVPQDLQTIVHKAIDKDPARRYSSAGELAADLQRFVEDEPIQARRQGQLERLGRWSRRHKAVAALLATLATVLTVGFFVMAILWTRAEHSADVARRNMQTAMDLAAKEEAARKEALALAEKEKKARGEADEKAEQLAREDYINRVNRAYREIQDDNIALAEDLLHGCEPGRRGWEWHFVERLCNSSRQVIDLANASAAALAYSPDGTWAVSGSGGQGSYSSGAATINIWDVNSGRRRTSLPGADGAVWDVAISPDGTKVAAGGAAGRVMVWDAATAQSVWARHERGLTAMSVAFSPDGKSLAAGYGGYSGNQVGRAKVWDVASGKEIKAFPGPKGGVNRLAFHRDGKRLALAGSEVVEIWNLETGGKLQDLKGHAKWIYCLAYSPDGKWLATGGWDNTVRLRDAATGALALTIFAHEGFVLNLAFGPDSRTLVTTSEDRSVRLWEVPSGRRLTTFHGHTDFVWAVAFRPDGREIATGSMEGSIRFWDLRTSRPAVVQHTGWVDRFAFRRDGLRVLSEAGNYRTDDLPTKGWNPVTGELDATLDGTSFDRLPADFLRGPLGYIEAANRRIFSVTSPDGRLVALPGGGEGSASASRSKEYTASSVIIRDATSGSVLQTLAGHSSDVVSLGFSPDGCRLVTASFDRTLKLWDTTTWQDVFTLRGHTAGVVSLAFSPDGTRIVSGGIDFTARVWNATPLAPEVTAEHDARYRKKVETLAQLKATTDEARRAEILAASGQWGVAAAAFARAVDREPGKLRLRYQLIDALLKAGDTRRVGLACDEMLARFGDSSNRLQALGVAGFCRLAKMAITEPAKIPVAHDLAAATDDNVRANILDQSGQWDLIADYRARIVKDNPADARAQFNLGFALSHLGKLDEASAAYREHLRLAPDSDAGYNNLGLIQGKQGRLDESIASLRKAVELKAANDKAQRNLAGALRAREIQHKLPSFLKGEYRPRDNAERRGLAELCVSKKLYHAGARLLADAFAADPKLADDLKFADRYNAACLAALAAAGQGEDAAKLDDAERARLRRQAFDWLRADLTLWTRQWESGQPADRPEAQRMLLHWQVDGDLAGIRDEAALARLLEAERKQWQGLWGDVKALLERGQRPTP